MMSWQGRYPHKVVTAQAAVRAIPRGRGLAGFTADVLATNKPMMMVFYESGLRLTSTLADGVYHLCARFDDVVAR
jgi:uncharacterized protein involved in propanediol utilization